VIQKKICIEVYDHQQANVYPIEIVIPYYGNYPIETWVSAGTNL